MKRRSMLLCLGILIASSAPSAETQFVKHGKTLEELSESSWSRDKLVKYESALLRFPGFEACLFDPNAVGSFRWSEIRTLVQLEVCLSHVHGHIGDPAQSVEWFREQGFRSAVYVYDRPHGIYRDVRAFGSFEGDENRNVSESPLFGWWNWMAFLGTKALSVGIDFDPNGQIRHVVATHPIK